MQYVTTAIVYPNARIHVGWAWECLGADWLVRSHRLMGRETFFATGMDEHAIKVQRAAEAKNLTPKEFCDGLSTDIQKVLRQMGLSYDRFIRTSDADHERVVKALVQRAYDKGDIYKNKYEGLYCEGCEAYYTEKDLKDGLCPAHSTRPKQISEENWFFKLSKYQDQLLKLYASNPTFLEPAYRKAEIVNFVEAGLKDFSVSRSTFSWGIPLPWDPKHIVYVWFDALINYLSAAGYAAVLDDPESAEAKLFWKRWPAKLHVIGKDISRFHCIYWPAMLMSLDLPQPEKVFAHGFISLKGERLSKSSGNVVTPDEVMAVTGADPFRYYLLAENQFAQDGNFSLELLMLKNNADLANDWGNLVNRSISMTRKYFPGQALSKPATQTHSKAVHESFMKLGAELEAAISAVDTSAYAAAATARSRVLNLYIDQTKPWALAKAAGLQGGGPAPSTSGGTPEARAAETELKEVLFTLLEGIRYAATALLSVLPFGMPDVFRQLALATPDEQGAFARLKWGEHAIQPIEPKPLYPRLEMPKDPEPVAT